MMSKLRQTIPIALTALGLSVVTSLTPKAIAGEKPECFMIDVSGKYTDLSHLCDSSSKTKQATTKQSSSSTEQPISSSNYSNCTPAGYSNAINYLPAAPLVPGLTPVAYLNTRFSNTAYASPRMLVRRFRQSGSQAPNTNVLSISNLIQQRRPVVILNRQVPTGGFVQTSLGANRR